MATKKASGLVASEAVPLAQTSPSHGTKSDDQTELPLTVSTSSSQIVQSVVSEIETAYEHVVVWIKSSQPENPRIRYIEGVSEDDQNHLYFLSALIRAQLYQVQCRSDLVRALSFAKDVKIPLSVIESFSILAKNNPLEDLARVYEASVRSSNRRRLGTFFTPTHEANSMVASFIRKNEANPQVVVDVGAGVGIFSQIAWKQWPTARVLAVDINPVTLGLQAIAVAVGQSAGLELLLADYSSWLNDFRPGGPVLYLGNPPYTRWQLLEPQERSRLVAMTKGLVGPRANLSTLFLAITLMKLRAQDSLLFIVPAGWMRAAYGSELRAYLRDQVLRKVTIRHADTWRFENAMVDAVVVEVGPIMSNAQKIAITDWDEVKFVYLARDLTTNQPFPRHRSSDVLDSTALEVNGKSVTLGEFLRVRRGTATGDNRFFVMNDREMVKSHIPAQFFRRVVRRLRPGADPTNPVAETSNILVLQQFPRGSVPSVEAKIAEAELRGVHHRHLCAARSPWFELGTELQEPDVIVSALSRDRFQVYVNELACAITNNLFGIYWQPSVLPEHKIRILSWLISPDGQRAMRSSASIEANGLQRLSPRKLGELQVPYNILEQDTDERSSEVRDV